MKKLFTFLALTLWAVGSVWAAESDNVLIKTVDFSASGWDSYRTAKEFTKTDEAVDGCVATSSPLVFTDDGEMNFGSSNLGDGNGNNALSIPLTGINGSIKVVITSTNSSSKVYWSIKEGESGSITNRVSTTAGSTQTINHTMTTSETTATLYIGRQSSKVAPQVTLIQVYTADASSVANPLISMSDNKVNISCTTDGATIYYTLDGTDPTTTSDVYSAAIPLTEDKLVKAFAYKGGNSSEIVSMYCGIDKTFNETSLVRFDDGNFTTPNGLTIEGITFGSGVSYQSTSANVDGLTLTAGIQFDGGNWNANRVMSFKVSGSCKVYIYGHSNSSGAPRYINVKTDSAPTSDSDGTLVGKNVGGYTDVSLFDYSGSATTIYFSPRATNYRVLAIKIVFGNENSFTASVGSTGFASLALPYAVTIPSGVTAYTGSLNGSGDAVTLTAIDDGIIPANTGVIIEASAGNYTFNETTSAGSASSSLGHTAGEGLDISGDDDTYYVLAKNSSDEAVFGLISSNSTYKVIPANKAYLKVAAGSSAPYLNMLIDDGTVTGVSSTVADKTVRSVKKYVKNGRIMIEDANGTFNVAGLQIK